MERKKFKVGDKVKITGQITSDASQNQGYVGIITHVQASSLFKKPKDIAQLGGSYWFKLDNKLCAWPNDLTLVTGAKCAEQAAPKFILQYELASDPFEVFCTEKELRARIAELAEKPELKRDSIRVYDVKRVRTVKLGVKITISK